MSYGSVYPDPPKGASMHKFFRRPKRFLLVGAAVLLGTAALNIPNSRFEAVRTGRTQADQGAGNPAGVDGRLDLPFRRRSHPGHGPRREGPQAVPLSRALSRGAGKHQIRAVIAFAERCLPSGRKCASTWLCAGCRARRCWRPSCIFWKPR